MKELTKKILEAGLIGKTVAAMLERWGQLTPEEMALAMNAKHVMSESLENFIENLEELISPEAAEIKETRLDIRVKQILELYSPGPAYFTAAEDDMGKLLVNPRYAFKVGALLYHDYDGVVTKLNPADAIYRVLAVDYLYKEDIVNIIQLTVEKIGE